MNVSTKFQEKGGENAVLNITEILSNNNKANMSYQSGRTDSAKENAANAAFNVMLQAMPVAVSQPEPQLSTPATVVENSTSYSDQKVENPKPTAATNTTEQPQQKAEAQSQIRQPNQPAQAVNRDETVKAQVHVNTSENKVVQAEEAQSVAPAVQRAKPVIVVTNEAVKPVNANVETTAAQPQVSQVAQKVISHIIAQADQAKPVVAQATTATQAKAIDPVLLSLNSQAIETQATSTRKVVPYTDLQLRDSSAKLINDVKQSRQGMTERPQVTVSQRVNFSDRPAEIASSTMPERQTVTKGDAPPIDGQTARSNSPAVQARQEVPTAAQASFNSEAKAEPMANVNQPMAAMPTVEAVPTTTVQPTLTANPATMATRQAEAMTVKPAAPAATTEVTIENVERVVRMVNQQMVRRAADGGGTMRLRLDPPELGRVKLEVTVEQQHVRAQAVVESGQVRQVLMEHLPDLKQQLAQQGMQLDQFDVAEQAVDQHQQSRFAFDRTADGRAERNANSSVEQPRSQVVAERPAATYRVSGLAGNLSILA
ncbi:MAG TPA: flagellar hook-length control protein FliK [bacterium]|nr:flagellar hook-length control protein FliK [bacterium]